MDGGSFLLATSRYIVQQNTTNPLPLPPPTLLHPLQQPFQRDGRVLPLPLQVGKDHIAVQIDGDAPKDIHLCVVCFEAWMGGDLIEATTLHKWLWSRTTESNHTHTHTYIYQIHVIHTKTHKHIQTHMYM